MNLCVNGQNRDYPAALNVEQLLAALELNRDQVVVELNREILIADKYVDIQLKDDDTLEVIQFVGGG
ncbi:MAG TPA: sulfur carrier protein ThiS [Desulfarculaceae bacterium]|nr:sulfur carrier protein ThiS [Desulfarculaceae bacterium]